MTASGKSPVGMLRPLGAGRLAGVLRPSSRAKRCEKRGRCKGALNSTRAALAYAGVGAAARFRRWWCPDG